jgi:hypothetical protein
MRLRLRSFARLTLLVVALSGCGARSDLLAGAGTHGGPTVPTCPQWVATHAPVQVSSIPSIVEAQSALATAAGVLVGYADAQLPPVDSTWHARIARFGDGALGPEETIFHHDTSALGWSLLSIAQGFGRGAAAASDAAQGTLFVPVDDDGAPLAGPVNILNSKGSDLMATSTGYSVVGGQFDPSGSLVSPIEVVVLNAAGGVFGSRILLDASTPLAWFQRFALAGSDFVLVWNETSTCSGCHAVRAQHFGEQGQTMTPAVTLRSFGAQDYSAWVVATSPTGMMLVRSDASASPGQLVAEPFDVDGNPLGPPQAFAQLSGQSASLLAMTAAPGGDFLVAWTEDGGQGSLMVQSVGRDGASEGPATMLGAIDTQPDSRVLVVASPRGAMVVYENDVLDYGVEVFVLPLGCNA